MRRMFPGTMQSVARCSSEWLSSYQVYQVIRSSSGELGKKLAPSHLSGCEMIKNLSKFLIRASLEPFGDVFHCRKCHPADLVAHFKVVAKALGPGCPRDFFP